MDLLTLEEVKDHLGIDYIDDMVQRNIERLIRVADSAMVGSLGKNYPKDDPRVKELALIVVDDLYSQRGMSEKVSGTVRKLITDFSTQLRVEMRGRDSNGVR